MEVEVEIEKEKEIDVEEKVMEEVEIPEHPKDEGEIK